jgi:transposase
LPTPSKKFCRRSKWSADRFHVAKLYRAAVDDLRKQEMKELKQILRKQQYAGLKGVLWKLRRNFEDLSDEDRQLLELLFECSPALRHTRCAKS